MCFTCVSLQVNSIVVAVCTATADMLWLGSCSCSTVITTGHGYLIGVFTSILVGILWISTWGTVTYSWIWKKKVQHGWEALSSSLKASFGNFKISIQIFHELQREPTKTSDMTKMFQGILITMGSREMYASWCLIISARRYPCPALCDCFVSHVLKALSPPCS